MKNRDCTKKFDIGERIKFFRMQKGYSINKLALLSGISQSYLRDVELGNKNPTVEVVSEICWALEISLKDFFDEHECDSFIHDPIISKIYRLSPIQRTALSSFIDTIING